MWCVYVCGVYDVYVCMYGVLCVCVYVCGACVYDMYMSACVYVWCMCVHTHACSSALQPRVCTGSGKCSPGQACTLATKYPQPPSSGRRRDAGGKSRAARDSTVSAGALGSRDDTRCRERLHDIPGVRGESQPSFREPCPLCRASTIAHQPDSLSAPWRAGLGRGAADWGSHSTVFLSCLWGDYFKLLEGA